MANVFQHKQMPRLTRRQKETTHHAHIQNGQHSGNTSCAPSISWHITTLDMLKKTLKQASITVYYKITGIQNNSQTLT